MSQRVAFASLPGVAALALPASLRELFALVARESPSPRALRAHLRSREWFEADGFPDLAAFLGLDRADVLSPGSLGRAVVDAADEADVREALARHLVDANPLLAKYCLEALDVDRGGRLHSTNELFRMVTSYVYPGARPTLTAFKAWVEWAAAAGLIRVVGIRWALGSGAAAVLPSLRAIDPEEFLEDERLEADRPVPPSGDPEPVAVAAPPVAPPIPATVPSRAAGRSRAAASPAAGAMDGVTPGPKSTQPSDVPAVSPEADVVAMLVARHAGAAGVVGPDLEALHLSAPDDDRGARLAMSFCALLLGRGLPVQAAGRVMRSFQARGAITQAADGRIPTTAVSEIVAADPDPAVVAACEALVHMPRLAAGLPDGSWSADPRMLLDLAWRRMYAPADPLAPFLLARLLWSLGRLDPRAAPAAFVPVFTVRANAFRLGIVDRLYAGSFADLADVALVLAARFGPPDFEAPLFRVSEDLGCAFGCRHTHGCPLPCREKTDVAPPARRGSP
jgi:hypothetical protein